MHIGYEVNMLYALRHLNIDETLDWLHLEHLMGMIPISNNTVQLAYTQGRPIH